MSNAKTFSKAKGNFSVCDMMERMAYAHTLDEECRDEIVQLWLKMVYNNFTSLHKALIDLISNFRKPYKFYKMINDAGTLIRFCKFALKRRILEEDGITIEPSYAELLDEIEYHLVNLVENGTDQNLSKRGLLVFMKDLMEKIMEAYDQPSLICYLLIDYDLMIEFIDQFLEDLERLALSKNSMALTENLSVLKNYLESLNKERINGDILDKILIAVENVSYDMARDFYEALWRIKFKEHYKDQTIEEFRKIQSGYRFGVLKALVVQPYGNVSDAYLMSDELLVQYVKCVKENLLELLKNNAVDLTNTLKGQLMILHEWLSFLTHLLITYQPEHNSEQKDFSNIRLDFQALARNVGSIILSCFENSEEIGLGFIDLIETMDVIHGEIIKNIYNMVLQKVEIESPKQDNMGFLILLLRNLKDCKPGLIVHWKDHENLVLFIFYLIQNCSSICNNECSSNIFQLDMDLINHAELNEVLISAQVAAFNMACHSLLRRYGRFRWWDLYLGTKENVDMHMCVGMLKAFLLSSTTPLTDELLIAYGECVRDCLVEQQKIEAFDPLRDQFNILHEELSFMVRLLISYMDEQDKLSKIKVDFQDLMRSIGSVICLRFNHTVNGDTALKQSTCELSNLLEKMKLIKSETQEILLLIILSKVGSESPKTNQLGSLNLLLENWKGLMDCESDLIITWKDQFQMIYENMVLFKSFITSSCYEDDESRHLCSTIVDTGHVAEYLLTIFSDGTCPTSCSERWILDLTSQVELIKADIMKVKGKISNMKEICIGEKNRNQVYSQAVQVPTSTLIDVVVVGFEVEMELIRERLAGHRNQLDVISIVGMPGLGKTTLAKKVFEDPFTISYFDVRAWCHVSQDYNTKDLLLEILGSKLNLTDEIRGKSETDLSVMVHQIFIGRRYFIVLDDIWDIKVFMYLKRFFPDDNQGSRIMLTTRSKVIGSQAQDHSDLIEPRMLTDEQSWDLLEQKVYKKEKCPSELCHIGKEIATKCRGLPLAIVVVAGVLSKGTQTQYFWEQVTGSLSSYLACDSQSHFMAALELSYSFLPESLKSMFLYLGAFPENKEIPVDKLMRLWMAEGFVENNESRSLEIQAEANLMDLIDRSLVMVAKRRLDGRVKVCRVHDLLRDICLAKAKEEKFLQQVDVHSELPDPIMCRQRLSIVVDRNYKTISKHLVTYKDLPRFSITPPVYSLLFFKVGDFIPDLDFKDEIKDQGDLAPVISSLKLLRVFDAENFGITQDVLDKDLIMLVHLRYVSFSGNIQSIPSSISRLQNLETLIIKGINFTTLPETIWKLTKLKHLHINSCAFSVAPDDPFILESLQTLSEPIIDIGNEKILFKKVPNLKKLRCTYRAIHGFPNLESLGKLESLTVSCWIKKRLTGQFMLPLTLKKLSITAFRMEWSQVSIFHELPSLEVLKLNDDAVEDEVWDMEDEEVFSNLKILKLNGLNIERWGASSENFPSLEKLVLAWCDKLEEIPSELGEVDTLQKIEVYGCGSSAVKMVKAIKKEQEDFGNESLKFYFYGN